MTTVKETLASRDGHYSGNYVELCALSQLLKRIMRGSPNWNKLGPDMKESLEMMQLKVARILCGDPHYKDHWHDAIGYLTLIDNKLND